MKKFSLALAPVLAASALLVASTLHAEAPMVTRGTVTRVTADEVTVKGTSGETTLKLAPDWSISVSAPAKLSDLEAGDFIGTSNVDIPGGGRALEVHIFPAGTNPSTGHQTTLDAKAGSKMTNGTVGKVVAASGGSELDVSFPGGTRHVKIPPSALITSVTPADRKMLKAGISVSVASFNDASGVPRARFISTGPNGSPPAR